MDRYLKYRKEFIANHTTHTISIIFSYDYLNDNKL